MRIEGNIYVMKEETGGSELRFLVEPDTAVLDGIEPGDRILAKPYLDDHTIAIRPNIPASQLQDFLLIRKDSARLLPIGGMYGTPWRKQPPVGLV